MSFVYEIENNLNSKKRGYNNNEVTPFTWKINTSFKVVAENKNANIKEVESIIQDIMYKFKNVNVIEEVSPFDKIKPSIENFIEEYVGLLQKDNRFIGYEVTSIRITSAMKYSISISFNNEKSKVDTLEKELGSLKASFNDFSDAVEQALERTELDAVHSKEVYVNTNLIRENQENPILETATNTDSSQEKILQKLNDTVQEQTTRLNPVQIGETSYRPQKTTGTRLFDKLIIK